MTYTFAEAKQRLARYASSYGLGDVSAALNEALDELARTRSWQRLRRIARLTVGGEYFALPQDCGQIRRAAVDGTPVRIVGADHEFLSGGPGDFDYLSRGLAPIFNIQRVGIYPTMFAPTAASKLAAFSTTAPTGSIFAKIRNADGDTLTVTVPCTVWAGTTDAAGLDAGTVTATALEATEILGITLPPDASDYISLYGVADGELTFLSRMHPRIRVPEFTRYRVPGFSSETDASYGLLVECGLQPLPLSDDNEPVPFDSLRSLQYMLQSLWYAESGELEHSAKYRAMAEASLLRREDTENERQTMLIINPLYEGSNGEVSTYWENC